MKGTKPDFHAAMANEPAQALYNEFLTTLEKEYRAMQTKLKIQSTKQ